MPYVTAAAKKLEVLHAYVAALSLLVDLAKSEVDSQGNPDPVAVAALRLARAQYWEAHDAYEAAVKERLGTTI